MESAWSLQGSFIYGDSGRLFQVGESSFNMTRGGGGEDIEGGLWKFLDTQKGALKICIL